MNVNQIGTARRVRGVWAGMIAAALFLPALAHAQQRMTLEDAVIMARENNPTFLSTANDQEVADWSVHGAYGNILPFANVSAGAQYQGAGVQRFGIFDFGVGTWRVRLLLWHHDRLLQYK